MIMTNHSYISTLIDSLVVAHRFFPFEMEMVIVSYLFMTHQINGLITRYCESIAIAILLQKIMGHKRSEHE